MSRIDDLIAKYCPNGVEYKAVAEVADIKNGSDYKHLSEGSIPVYGSGGIMGVRVSVAAYDKPTVLLPREGSISNVFYVDEPFWNIDTVFYTVIDTSKITPRYFYHVMLNAHIERYSTGSAARPSLTQTALKKIKIPVPPLEVQEKILEILDSVTPLEARRKQSESESCRNKPLSYSDDVPLVRLMDIADIGTGSSNTNEAIDAGKYLFFVRSQEPLRKNDYDFDETAIITAGDGAVGKVFHYVDGKYALHQRAYRIHINTPSVYPKFFFHYMKSAFLPYIEKTMYHSSVPSIRRPMLNRFPVPVPPLEEQKRIVRILDSFTQLEAELEAELEARRKQYEYYRDSLRDVSNQENHLGKKVEIIALEETCNISAGGDAPKDSMCKYKTDKYKVPIISNGIGENALYGYTDIAKINTPAVTIAARGTIGYAEYRDYPYFPIIRLLTAIPKDTSLLNTKYLYYCLQGKKYQLPNGGIPQLTAPQLKKVKIPVPPLSEQERIVAILDKFDALVNDLSSGLPAEIAARRKQYEYYRDQLLTFTPRKVTA